MRRIILSLLVSLFLISSVALIATGCTSGATPSIINKMVGSVGASMDEVVELLQRAVAEGLHEKYPALQACEVLVKDRDSGTSYGRLVLTWANPNGSVGGIPAGRWVMVYVNAYSTANEALFGPTTLITTGQSVAVQIVAGQVVPASVVLNPTSPIFSGQTPAHGSTTYGVTNIVTGAHVADIGGGVSTCNVYVDNVLRATQVTNNPSVSVPVVTGTHSVRIDATTTSGGTATSSWSFQVVNVLEPFSEWPGHVVTFYIPTGAIAYNQMVATFKTPPGSAKAQVNIFFYDDVGNLAINGEVDLSTGAVSGTEVGWYEHVGTEDVFHKYPNGVWSSGQVVYDKLGDLDPATGTITLPSVHIDTDGDGSANHSGTITAPETAYQPY